MPRTTKGTGGRGGKRHPLNMRTTKETRDRLEAAAIANGRSLAQEVETRLERSFGEDDRFGGPAMLPIVNMMVGAFLRGGQMGAAARGHPEWTPAEWINDHVCYRAAAFAVGSALNLPIRAGGPIDDPAAVHDVMASLIEQGAAISVSAENARGAPVKVSHGDEK